MIHPRANKAAFRGGREGMETKEAGLDALPPAVKDALEAAKKAKETPK
jgi:hypothetical protein